MGNGVKISLQLASFLDYKISYEYSHVREKISNYDCTVRRTITYESCDFFQVTEQQFELCSK